MAAELDAVAALFGLGGGTAAAVSGRLLELLAFEAVDEDDGRGGGGTFAAESCLFDDIAVAEF